MPPLADRILLNDYFCLLSFGWQIDLAILTLDLVLFDPPRAGLHVKARQALLKLNPKQIIYISCGLTTLARGLKVLHESDYHVDSLQAFDMCLQTIHIETVVLISRE